MEIVERDVSSEHAKPPSISTQEGFPQAHKLKVDSDADPSSYGKKNKSLFARQAEKQRKDATSEHVSRGSAAQSASGGSISGGDSMVVDGSGLGSSEEAAAIHRQNAAALASMTEEERLDSQQQLASGIDPKLLEFIRKRRAVTVPVPAKRPPPDPESGPVPTCLETAAGQSAGESTSQPAGESETPMDTTRTGDAAMAELEKVRDQLPIDLDEARGWPHMDKIEPEKLLWMTELPAPKVEHGKTGFTARFDFEGRLLPYAAAPPPESALYHHGEEPGRAGYAVDDMFRLVRSAVQQQRVLGLQSLTSLLTKTKSGVYDGLLEPPLLGRLLEAGLLLLLRFALDDTAEPVLTAALAATEALLDCRPDEVCLDRTLGWSRGLEQPSLPTPLDTEPETAEQYQTDEAGLKDDAVTRLDAIRALVRTDTLPRVRYILEVVCPAPPAVLSAVRLLTRCCRHSLQLAAEVASCPRLLDTLITAFLPVCGTAPLEGSEPVERLSTVYGVPLHPVLKLLRVLCCQSGQLAGRLVRRRPRLMQALLSYVAINPGESGMPTQEVLTLAIESYRLWAVLLSYNQADASFIDFFPLLVRQLHFCLSSVSVNEDQAAHRFNHDLATWLLALCRAAVCAAFSNHQTELLNRTGVDPTSPGVLRWGHVAGLLVPVEQCTRKWLTEAARTDTLTDNAVQLLAACCQLLGAFHERWARLGLDDTVARLARLRTLADVTIAPFVTSQACRSQLAKLREFSNLLSDEASGRQRDPASLPSLGAVSWRTGQVAPLLRAGSPVPLVTALLQLVRAACSLHPGLTDTICRPLVEDSAAAGYLASLAATETLSLVGDWFSRHELHLATELLLLTASQESSNLLQCHAVGLRLLPCYQTGDEHLCAELMRHVVFNRSLLTAPSDPAGEAALAQLVSSYSLYERCLLRPAAAAASRDRADSLAGRVAALAARDSGATLLPTDWWYAPLVRLYERNNPQGGEEQPAPPAPAAPAAALTAPAPKAAPVAPAAPAARVDPKAELHGVEPARVADRCLQLLNLLFTHHRPVVAALSVTAHFARVCCVFLAGDDLFLDPAVQRGLRQVLCHVLEDPDRLDLTADVPGLASFGDLYTQLLDQFEGVSYGEALFGAVIMVPLEPRQPTELRRALWVERPHALRAITTRPEQLLVPLERYLAARETDEVLLKTYRTALRRGAVTAARNPALYRVAAALCGGSG